MVWRIICDNSDLAFDCARSGNAVGLGIDPTVSDRWFAESSKSIEKGESIAVALVEPPSLAQLVALAHEAYNKSQQIALAIVGDSESSKKLLDAAGDLGILSVCEISPLIAVISLAVAKATTPWIASTRTLPSPDRARLKSVFNSNQRTKAFLIRQDDGLVAWVSEPGSSATKLGDPADIAPAIAAYKAAERPSIEVESNVEGVDHQAVLDVLFGPPRALSDPASKAALASYGIAMPVEELCSSASRAAAEANRIGFPVRVALASPDLRIWDHPDLAVDLIDNTARVREVFGLLTTSAKSRAPESRFLGVTVTVANQASALLQIRAWPLSHGRVAIDIGFADVHGKATSDATTAILPATTYAIERALGRLRGSELILGGTKARRRRNFEAVSDTLQRLAAFINDRAKEIESVELLPLALLAEGGVEVREACITVSDLFERSINRGDRNYRDRSAHV